MILGDNIVFWGVMGHAGLESPKELASCQHWQGRASQEGSWKVHALDLGEGRSLPEHMHVSVTTC